MWVRLDDGFPEHPKILRLSDRAFRLHVTAMCWSARQLTDGRVPVEWIRERPGLRVAVHELTVVGLWEHVDADYLVHDWEDWNPSAETIAQQRKNRIERQRRYRERRRRDEDGDAS